MKNEFEKQWNQLSLKSRNAKCPKTDEEIERMIASVVSGGSHSWGRRSVWFCSIAAACIAGIVVMASSKKSAVPTVKVNGSEVYYLSNGNCSAEKAIDMFNSLIH